jgi:hypothetical protein
LHCTVTAGHEPYMDDFAAALRDAVEQVASVARRGEAGAYGTVE